MRIKMDKWSIIIEAETPLEADKFKRMMKENIKKILEDENEGMLEPVRVRGLGVSKLPPNRISQT